MTQSDLMEINPWDRHRVTLESGFVAALLAGAFLVRLWGLSKMHFWDENVYLLNAGYIAFGKANYIEIDSRPPLLPILFAGAFRLWHSDYAAWIVTALLNALGPVFLYLAGRKLTGGLRPRSRRFCLLSLRSSRGSSQTDRADSWLTFPVTACWQTVPLFR